MPAAILFADSGHDVAQRREALVDELRLLEHSPTGPRLLHRLRASQVAKRELADKRRAWRTSEDDARVSLRRAENRKGGGQRRTGLLVGRLHQQRDKHVRAAAGGVHLGRRHSPFGVAVHYLGVHLRLATSSQVRF